MKVMRGEAELPERSCADLSTGRLYDPEDYLAVKPEDRMFIWPRDVKRATEALKLSSGPRRNNCDRLAVDEG